MNNMMSTGPTAWERMRLGDADGALDQMRVEFSCNPDSSHLISLGIGYLWCHKYKEAANHFTAAISSRPKYMDTIYAMAGVAWWCLDRRTAAVDVWRDGIGCEFQDPSGIGVVLLLYFAAVLEPKLVTRAEVEAMLSKCLTLPQASIWPGALGKYLLHKCDRDELDSECNGGYRDENMIRNWYTAFYRGVIAYANGDLGRYHIAMRDVADLSRPEWEVRQFFFSAVWSEEFFLARHESL